MASIKKYAFLAIISADEKLPAVKIPFWFFSETNQASHASGISPFSSSSRSAALNPSPYGRRISNNVASSAFHTSGISHFSGVSFHKLHMMQYLLSAVSIVISGSCTKSVVSWVNTTHQFKEKSNTYKSVGKIGR